MATTTSSSTRVKIFSVRKEIIRMVSEGHSLRVIYHSIRAAGNLTNCSEKQFYYHVKRMRKADADIARLAAVDSARLAAVDSIRYAVADITRLAAADAAHIAANSRTIPKISKAPQKRSATTSKRDNGYVGSKNTKLSPDFFAAAKS